MTRLAHYLMAMKTPAYDGSVTVVAREQYDRSYQDQEVHVIYVESLVRFNDGALIRCSEELDQVESEALCAECWLTYQVVEHPETPIEPAAKHFTNRCQQAFWLKMQAAHL